MKLWIAAAMALSGVLLLSACVTAYVEPTGPDTAEITFVNKTQNYAFVTAYKDPTDCSGPQSLVGTDPKPEQLTHRIAAERYVAMTITMFAGNENCEAAFDFYPRRGRHYIARYSLERENCYVFLTETHGGGGETRVHINKRVYGVPLAFNSPSCYRDDIDRSKPPADTPDTAP